jgi:hypothetical protein
MHFVIFSAPGLANIAVKSYRKLAAAETAAATANPAVNGYTAIIVPDDDLKGVPMPLLIALHNLIRPERPVTRFSDRATAEIRLKGVLEVLAKPGDAAPTPTPAPAVEGSTVGSEGSEGPAGSPSSTEDTTVATKTKKAKKDRISAATPISDATVRKCIKLRGEGVAWPEILKQIGEKPSFVLRVRPLMKKEDKSSVRKITRANAK